MSDAALADQSSRSSPLARHKPSPWFNVLAGAVVVLGKDKEYIAGKTGDIFQAGVVANIATFHKMIATGDFANPTVAPAVQSNLITIMGRTAAYQRRLVTWDEIVNCTERLDPKLSSLKA